MEQLEEESNKEKLKIVRQSNRRGGKKHGDRLSN
jgi:hypothetical protein